MPVINAITALYLFHGLGLWTSIYAPKSAKYERIFGINDMSALGMAVLLGTIIICMQLPSVLRSLVPEAVEPGNWWLTLPPAGVALMFYIISLRVVSGFLPARRESLLAVMETAG